MYVRTYNENAPIHFRPLIVDFLFQIRKILNHYVGRLSIIHYYNQSLK